MALPVKNFFGKINDRNIYDFTKQLDYTIDSQQERIKLLKEILENDNGYFEELFIQNYDEAIDKDKCYWDQEDECYLTYEDYINKYSRDSLHDGKSHTGKNVSHIKLCLNTSDGLYSDTNIAKQLERMADYILYAPDGEKINKKTEYNFYTEDKFKQKMIREGETSLNNIVDKVTKKNECMEEPEVIDFLIREGNNYKLEKKQKIYKKDIDDIKEIQEYQNAINKLKEKRNNTKKVYDKKKINRMCSSMVEDMLDCKDMRKGTIYFKQPLVDEGKIDYDKFSFLEKEQVFMLLHMKPREDLQDDLACLIYDLEKLIDDCNFGNVELDIIDMLRSEYDKSDIAKELKVSRQAVSSMLNKIVNKIMNKYLDEKEDWFYLNVAKGKYKKCSKCGKVLIANERHFKWDKTNKRWKSQCINCLRKSSKNWGK